MGNDPAMLRAMRVLVVDDDIDTAEMIAESLRLNGFEVAVANDALAALEVAKVFMPQIALLDIALPEMDGYELARRLAIDGVACRLIAITGCGRDEDRARSAGAGFALHLVKPVPAAAILAAIGP